MESLNKKIKEANEKASIDAINKQLDDYSKLLQATASYNEQKLAINKKYDDLEKTARGNISATEEETRQRLAIIKQSREDDLADLENNINRQSDLYRKLGEDMTFFSIEQLKKRATDLEKYLLTNALPPALKASTKLAIDQINQLLHETDPISKKTLETAAEFGAIANGLNDISGALSGI